MITKPSNHLYPSDSLTVNESKDNLVPSGQLFPSDGLAVGVGTSLGTVENDFYFFNIEGYYSGNPDYQLSDIINGNFYYADNEYFRIIKSKTLNVVKKDAYASLELKYNYITDIDVDYESGELTLKSNDKEISSVNILAGKLIDDIKSENGAFIITQKNGTYREFNLRKSISEAFNNKHAINDKDISDLVGDL